MDFSRPKKIWSVSKQVAQQPWCVFATGLLAYVGHAAIDKYVLEGQSLNGALVFLWEKTTGFAQLPLVQLLMIPFAIWLFARGVSQIMKSNKALEDEKAQVYGDALNAVLVTLQPLADLVTLEANRNATQHARAKAEVLAAAVNAHAQYIHDLRGAVQDVGAEHDFRSRFPSRAFVYAADQVPRELVSAYTGNIPNPTCPAPKLVLNNPPLHGQQAMVHRTDRYDFDPADNGAFFAHCELDLAEMRRFSDAITGKVKEQQSQIDAKNEMLWKAING